jgi:hypothetical protein
MRHLMEKEEAQERQGRAGRKANDSPLRPKPRILASNLTAGDLNHHVFKESPDGGAKSQDTSRDDHGYPGQEEAILHGGSTGLISEKLPYQVHDDLLATGGLTYCYQAISVGFGLNAHKME